MMTAKELIKELSELPPHIEIYFDEEIDDQTAIAISRVRYRKNINRRVIDLDGRVRTVREGVFVLR